MVLIGRFLCFRNVKLFMGLISTEERDVFCLVVKFGVLDPIVVVADSSVNSKSSQI